MRMEDVERAAGLVEELKEIRKARRALEKTQRDGIEVEISIPTNRMVRPHDVEIEVTRESLVFMLQANEGAIEHALHVLGVEFVQPDDPEGAVADGL